MFGLFLSLVACGMEEAPADVLPPQTWEIAPDVMVSKVKDIWFMTMMIAFLMMFIKKYEWGVFVCTMLSAASSFLMFVFMKTVWFGHHWDICMQTEGAICAITCTIGIGVFMGTIKSWQYIIAGIFFGMSYYLVDYIVVTGEVMKGVVDPGGAIPVHMFAAYWGIGVALTLREKRVCGYEPFFTTHSVNWAWLASAVLWVLWPSFVTVFWTGDAAQEGSNVCIMGGLGSMLSGYLAEFAFKKGKVDPLVYAYALLAGCIGISSAMFIVGPWGGFLIGIISGIVSAIAFNFIHAKLTRLLGINDVMGVHNLHGVCSWVSVICGMIACYCKDFAGVWTLLSAFISFGIALVTGAILGVILKFTKFGEIENGDLMNDRADFVFPAEAEEGKPETEL